MRPAVVIADSFGRAWRLGQTDVAIGAAGLAALDDWAGRPDAYGRELRATAIAVADAVAAAADLARAKDSREPAVLVRGLERFVTRRGRPGRRGAAAPARAGPVPLASRLEPRSTEGTWPRKKSRTSACWTTTSAAPGRRRRRRGASTVTNPATGETLARVPLSSAADLDAAVAAARAALPAWRAVSVIERGRRLFALREGLDARREELARSVTAEMGKTIGDARAEVARMIEMVEAACAVPTTMQGRIIEDVSRNVDAETVRQPVGVCAAIVPFNFPAMVPFWFLPFAIACGNTFILKPSEQVPLTQQIAFEVLDGLDLPPGVVNLVNGGREVVEGILDHPGIDAVSFVGSAPVARIVYERAAKTGKRVQALGGAKNHMVVMPDAVIDKTVDGIIGSAFGAAGQRCMAGSVVVTVGEAHDLLMPALREATEALQRRRRQRREHRRGPGRVLRGARPHPGGDRPRPWPRAPSWWWTGARPTPTRRGAFVGPTILDRRATRASELAREEIFGPVLSIVHVDTLDEAIEVVNGSRFGNGTSIFTESGASVRRYRHEVEAGHGRREHRRGRAGGVLPVLGLEGLLPRRPARPRPRRGRVLHPQEDRHQPLVLERPGQPGRTSSSSSSITGSRTRRPLATSPSASPAGLRPARSAPLRSRPPPGRRS